MMHNKMVITSKAVIIIKSINQKNLFLKQPRQILAMVL